MAVEKTLEIIYDLSSLNEEQSSQLIAANESMIKKSETEKKKKKKLKQLDDKEIKQEEKDSKKRLANLKEEESKIKEFSDSEVVEELITTELGAQKGINFFASKFKSSLPIIGPILVASSFFINELLKLDSLAKKFLDIADTRINVFIDRQEQARLDTHLDQIIYTTKAGTTAPRDSYNSFNAYDRVLKTDGRDRDASSIGGVD